MKKSHFTLNIKDTFRLTFSVLLEKHSEVSLSNTYLEGQVNN